MSATLTREEAIVSKDELDRFHQFCLEQIQRAEIDWTWRDLLDAWRRRDPNSAEYQADLAAIREALADRDAGDEGVPYDEFMKQFRHENKARYGT
jgi:hypothetical protein